MKKMRLTALLGVASLLVLLVGLALAASPGLSTKAAVQATCTTTASGSWNGPIWDCPGGPTAADDVVILHDVSFTTDASVHGVKIDTNPAQNLYGILRFDAPATLTLTGDLDVSLDGILSAGPIVADGVPDTGGTIVFAGTSQSVFSRGKWLDFWNLTKTGTSAGDTLAFQPPVAGEGGVHVLNVLSLHGTPGAYLLLRSTTPGTQAALRVDEMYDINYINVQDSNNNSPEIGVFNIDQGIDAGNLTNWAFVGTHTGLTSSENPTVIGSTVTFTATVSPSDATGTVTFLKNGEHIDACENVALTGSSASCALTFSETGAVTISAVFNADAPWTSSVSAPVLEIVGRVKVFVPHVEK